MRNYLAICLLIAMVQVVAQSVVIIAMPSDAGQVPVIVYTLLPLVTFISSLAVTYNAVKRTNEIARHV